jgi:hypothetical protein
MYRHYIPKLNLSIERNTEKVPLDGKFHLLKDGMELESFRSKKKAEEKFKQIVGESGYKPEISKTSPADSMSETVDRFLRDKTIFYAEGPKYKRRGGRGR